MLRHRDSDASIPDLQDLMPFWHQICCCVFASKPRDSMPPNNFHGRGALHGERFWRFNSGGLGLNKFDSILLSLAFVGMVRFHESHEPL